MVVVVLVKWSCREGGTRLAYAVRLDTGGCFGGNGGEGKVSRRGGGGGGRMLYLFLAKLFSELRGSLTQNRQKKINNIYFFNGSRCVPRPMVVLHPVVAVFFFSRSVFGRGLKLRV